MASIADATLSEPDVGTASMLFTLTLSEPTSATQGTSVATSDGTATASGPGVADDDYDVVSTTGTFAPDQTSIQVAVPIVGNDIYEHDEVFTMTMTSTVLEIGDGTAERHDHERQGDPRPQHRGRQREREGHRRHHLALLHLRIALAPLVVHHDRILDDRELHGRRRHRLPRGGGDAEHHAGRHVDDLDAQAAAHR